jgi:hypothetical protein
MASQQIRTRVFSADQTREFLPLLGRCDQSWTVGIDSTWTPTDRESHALTLQLLAALTDAGALTPQGYRMQYFGVVREGSMAILINAFHEEVSPTLTETERLDREWLHVPIVFCDGGRATFQAEYEVSANRLSPLQFGGRFGT